MSHDCCPHCRTRSGISAYISLLLSFDNIPAVIIYSAIVLAYGDKLGLSSAASGVFVALVAIPLSMRVVRKFSCENCGAEFRATEPNTPAIENIKF